MRPDNEVIAVCISDIHLSLKTPACRADDNWLNTQARYLGQVSDYAKAKRVPVLCAGDIFDRWNPPPELITFALCTLPDKMIAIPGQHDLPNHRIEDMHRSGYGVLREAGKIIDVSTTGFIDLEGDFALRGFGWNQKIEPPFHDSQKQVKCVHVALIHRYCWTEDKRFFGATEGNVTGYKKLLRGYDVAFFGDNHHSFIATAGDCTVFNCGTFIRRKSDEIPFQPCMGILYADGTVKRRRLNVELDKFHEDADKRVEVPVNMRVFIKELRELGEQGLDFTEAVRNHLRSDDIDGPVKEMILKALETKE